MDTSYTSTIYGADRKTLATFNDYEYHPEIFPLSVSPNPVHSFFTIQSQTVLEQPVLFNLIDMAGVSILVRQIPKGRIDQVISIEGFAAGIYHYSLVSKKGEILSRGILIKQAY